MNVESLIQRLEKGGDYVRNGKYYLTNESLLPAVLEAKEKNVLTDKLAAMLCLLTEKYSSRLNYYRYSYREDMVSYALMILCNNALKFDPEKSSNPFSYYTTCIDRAFMQYLNEEKKQRNIRDTLISDAGLMPSHTFQEENSSQNHESGTVENRNVDEYSKSDSYVKQQNYENYDNQEHD
jgi:DNA-directed RNA polymerase specialized sigma subunit